MTSINPNSRYRIWRALAPVLACLLLAACEQADPPGYFTLAPEAAAPRSTTLSISDANQPPVIGRGAPGSWDSSDVLNPSVVRFKGELYNYFSGYDGRTWQTGLATSSNGRNWTIYPHNPILSPGNGWSTSYIAANGSAIVWQGKVLYFYQGRSAQGITEIGLATSSNGVAFESLPAPVLTPGPPHTWDSAAVGDPYVIEFGGKLFMYYLGMDELDVQRLGVAESADGIHWTRFIENPILDVGRKGSFDENGLGEPSIIFDPPDFYMLYTGRAHDEVRDIGWAVSRDGVHWKKMSDTGLFGNQRRGAWDTQVVCDTTMLRVGNGKVSVWFGGGDKRKPAQGLNGQIGHFFLHLPLIPSSFDANADPPRGVLLGGWQPDGAAGHRSAWAGPRASVYLMKPKGPQQLVVSGWLPYSLYQRAGLKGPVTINVRVNGKTVASRAIGSTELFTITVTAPTVQRAMGAASIADVAVDTNHSFVPSHFWKSPDERTLSLKIIRIAFE